MTARSNPPILDSNKYSYLGRKIGSDLTVPLNMPNKESLKL